MPRRPGPDAIKQYWWQQFLSGSAAAIAALDMRLRGAHGVTFRDRITAEGYRRLHAVLETHAPEYVRDQLDYLQHES